MAVKTWRYLKETCKGRGRACGGTCACGGWRGCLCIACLLPAAGGTCEEEPGSAKGVDKHAQVQGHTKRSGNAIAAPLP